MTTDFNGIDINTLKKAEAQTVTIHTVSLGENLWWVFLKGVTSAGCLTNNVQEAIDNYTRELNSCDDLKYVGGLTWILTE